MTEQPLAALAAIVGIAYLAVVGYAITVTTYDTWGALIVLPPILLVGSWLMRRIFAGELRRVGTVMIVGLGLKMVGAAARYWVGFEAYAGGIDAARYHQFASARAAAVWSGEMNPANLIPTSRGTPFMEEVTAVVYTMTGSSLLGGFFVFAFIAYIGTAFFVKAACIAVPGVLQHRYALLCVVAPSIVYWPSSIGKEAWMFLTLGIATYGIARLLTRQGFIVPAVTAGVALLGAGLLRPHLAALWIAGAVPAGFIALFARRITGDGGRRSVDVVIASIMVVLAVGGLTVAAGATLRFLNFADEGDTGFDAVTAIVEETTRRTVQARSNFETMSITDPRDWPFASIRTLTRPTIIEARGAGELLSALEMTLIIGLAALSWRRLANLPRLLFTSPFVTYGFTVLFVGSLAFTSFGNLGILTRQRTLLFPFLLLLLVLPTRREQLDQAEEHNERETALGDAGAWSPSELHPAAGRDDFGRDAVGAVAAGPAAWRPTRQRANTGAIPVEWERSTPRRTSDDGIVTAEYHDPADPGRSDRPLRPSAPSPWQQRSRRRTVDPDDQS